MFKRLCFVVLFILLLVLSVFAADETITTGINFLNELTYYTSLIEIENSRIGLDSLYNDLLNNYDSQSIDADTNARMVSLLHTITDLKIINLKKERLEIIYDYKKSQTIADSLPSVFSVIATTKYFGDAALSLSSGDSKEAMIKGAKGLTVLASSIVSSYFTHKAAKDSLTADYLTDKYELEYQQIRSFDSMVSESFSCQSDYASSNKISNEYVLNKQLAEAFASCLTQENKGKALDFLKEKSESYKYFPRYWLELAGLYYQNGFYKECIETIDKYNLKFDYKQIYRKNIRYGQILVYGVSACINLCPKEFSEEEMLEKIIPWLDIITEETADDDWYQKYYCAMVYLMVYDKTGEKQYLESAYKLIKSNINILYDRQEKLNESYVSKITKPSGDQYKQMSETQEKETKAYYEKLEKDQKKLPQMDPSLVSNLKILIQLIQYFDVGSIDDIKYANDIICAPQLKAYINGDKYLEGKRYGYDYDDFSLYMPWLIAFGNSMVLKIPAVFLNDGSKIYFKYDNQEEFTEYWNPQSIEKNTENLNAVSISDVTRKEELEDYTVSLTFSLTDDMKKNATDKDDFMCTIRIDTNDCPIDLFFGGKSAFNCELLSIKAVYDEDINSFYSSFSKMSW